MKNKKGFSALVVVLTFVGLVALGPSTASAQSGAPISTNGAFTVSVLRDGTWQPVGTLAFGQNLTEQPLDLSGLVSAGQATVRLMNPGSTAAHIDARCRIAWLPFSIFHEPRQYRRAH